MSAQNPESRALPAPNRRASARVIVVAVALAAALAATAWASGLWPRAPEPAAPSYGAVLAPRAPQSAPSPADSSALAQPAPSWPALASGQGSTAGAPAQGGLFPAQPVAPALAASPPSPAWAPPSAPPAAIDSCRSCGRVASVREVRQQERPSGWGAAAGAVGGGLLGSAFGNGRGRAATVVLGAVGGGLAGNAIERRMRAREAWIVGVRMDNGKWRQQTFTRPPPFGVGQRVRYGRSGLAAY